jgi:signal transduction histidine kinase
LGVAALSTIAALLFAGFAIGHVFERFVMRGLDDRLDAQVQVLARAVRPDGTLDRTRVINLPGFDEPNAGWAWRVDGPRGMQSTNAAGLKMVEKGDPRAGTAVRPGPHEFADREPRPGEGHDGRGKAVHIRTVTLTTSAGQVSISASGPRRIVDAPVREAMVPLLLSLGLLGIGLGFATLLQLRFGLKPLRDMQTRVAEVVAGDRLHVPTDQPTELVPLAGELNRLIDRNEERLEHARRHAANLAHGLKTPLAALRLNVADAGAGWNDRESLVAAIDQMDRRITHHLRRARAAAPGGIDRARTLLAPAIDDLLAVLARIYADRDIDVVLQAVPDCTMAIDPQDLDEMLGNVLDNAWRHARSRIAISAAIVDLTNLVRVVIEDDGHGLPESDPAAAIIRGQRMDEGGEGHGFGLAITQELAQLYGGRIELGLSSLGGAAILIELPTRRHARD